MPQFPQHSNLGSTMNLASTYCFHELNEHFVLSGRGSQIYNWPGNVKMREVVEKKLGEYTAATKQRDKSQVVNTTVAQLDGMVFVKNTRLSDYVAGPWTPLDMRSTRKKIAHTFRDLQTKTRRLSTQRRLVSPEVSRRESITNHQSTSGSAISPTSVPSFSQATAVTDSSVNESCLDSSTCSEIGANLERSMNPPIETVDFSFPEEIHLQEESNSLETLWDDDVIQNLGNGARDDVPNNNNRSPQEFSWQEDDMPGLSAYI